MSRWMKLGIAALVLEATPAAAQYIGIFMDANATSCAAQVGANPWIELHVVAVLEGPVTEMTVAGFTITGVPESWTAQNVLWVPDARVTISLGNPLFRPTGSAERGVDMAFSSCQETARVALGRLVILGAPTAENVRLRIEGGSPGSVGRFNCPLLCVCDFQYSKVCVGGGEIVLNGSAPASCTPTAVEPSTWTNVKALYRD